MNTRITISKAALLMAISVIVTASGSCANTDDSLSPEAKERLQEVTDRLAKEYEERQQEALSKLTKKELESKIQSRYELIYELHEDVETRKGVPTDIDLNNVASALLDRFNRLGYDNIIAEKHGKNKMKVVIPRATPREAALLKWRIAKPSGHVEFRITASPTFAAHREIVTAAQNLTHLEREVWIDEEPLARWVPVRKGSPILTRTDNAYVKRNVNGDTQALVLLNDDINIRGKDFKYARVGRDSTNQPAVLFYMTKTGAFRLGQLTKRFMPTASGHRYHLGILVGKELISAPSINGRILESGEISGIGTEQEAERIASFINAGSLPPVLNHIPVSEKRTELPTSSDGGTTQVEADS